MFTLAVFPKGAKVVVGISGALFLFSPVTVLFCFRAVIPGDSAHNPVSECYGDITTAIRVQCRLGKSRKPLDSFRVPTTRELALSSCCRPEGESRRLDLVMIAPTETRGIRYYLPSFLNYCTFRV